jgi:hypothetical protein
VIGAALLPALSGLTSRLADWITKMTQSGRLQRDVNAGLTDAKQIIGGVKDVLSALLPPLQSVIGAVGGLGNAVKIMVAIWAAWKISSIITSLVSLGAGITGVGTTATVATGEVSALRLALAGIASLGLITVGIELLINRKSIASKLDSSNFLGSKSVDEFVRKNIPGGAALQNAVFGKGFADKLAGTSTQGQFTGSLQQLQLKAKIDPLFKGLLDSIDKTAQEAGAKGAKAREFLKGQLVIGPNDTLVKLPDPSTVFGLGPLVDGFKKAAVDTQKKVSKTLTDSLKGGVSAGVAAGTGTAATSAAISQAQQNINLLGTKLSQSIAQNTIDIQNSVNQAKQNLASIGQSLASSVGSVLDQPLTNLQNKLTLAQNKLSLNQLRRSALLPGGRQLSTDPNKAIAELKSLAARASTVTKPAIEAFLLQYQQASLSVAQDQVNQQKITANRTINDITDGINTGRLSIAKGRDQLLALLKRDGVNYKTAGKLLGTAFADGFEAQLTGIQKQAAALKGFTGGATGSGQQATIVQPALLVAKDQREIAQQQLVIAKKNTALQTKIATSTAKTAATLKELAGTPVNPSALDRNKGVQKKKSTALVGSVRPG